MANLLNNLGGVMLSQLNRLSIDADGRYATAQELQFLKDYLQNVNQRITTYEKLRDSEEIIVTKLAEGVLSLDPHVFHNATEEYKAFCFRDRHTALRCMSAAMLFNDLDSLLNGVLCWVRTIINSTVGYGRCATNNYKIMPNIIAEHINSDEMEFMRPVIDLTRSTLTDGLGS